MSTSNSIIKWLNCNIFEELQRKDLLNKLGRPCQYYGNL